MIFSDPSLSAEASNLMGGAGQGFVQAERRCDLSVTSAERAFPDDAWSGFLGAGR